MTSSIEISHRLAEWAALAGYALTPGSSTPDGRAMLWSAGGEVRHFIGSGRDGWFTITDSDRLGPEYFKLAAASMSIVEKYFFGTFGRLIRRKSNLPRINVPITVEEMSAEFAIKLGMFENAERLTLVDSVGSHLAFGSADPLYGTMQLVGLSRYLTATIDDITSAFLDPSGSPLFTLR
jgi:hypothetical protein